MLLMVACGESGSGDEPSDPSAPHSLLWGAQGELWSPQGRLPDFSHAGYHAGRDPLPRVSQVADVRDFGAVGDGLSDDTGAFLAALDAVSGGALLIPEGRYRITRPLRIERSGVVLRGAGRGRTVLVFPLSLREVLGKGPHGGPHGWSWGGGWIWAQGEFEEASALAQVTAAASRGGRELRVDSTTGLEPGQRVRLAQYEADGSLTRHLHAGFPLMGRCQVDRPGFRVVDWAVRIEEVGRRRVLLDRPLRVDVRTAWKAELLPYRPTVTEVGVEHLTIEFPSTDHDGHHNEPGFNGIYFERVDNSWVRDVEVVNFDSGVVFWASRYSMAEGILLTGRGGHYGLSLGACQDSLMTAFDIRNVSLHDLSVSNLGNGNVFSRGRGESINFDHHRGAPYENLFSDIDVGNAWKSDRIWRCSGTPSGHYTAARETFWNIQPRIRGRSLPEWPQMLVIGRMRGKQPLAPRLDAWLEDQPDLEPRDLHGAQRKRRWGP